MKNVLSDCSLELSNIIFDASKKRKGSKDISEKNQPVLKLPPVFLSVTDGRKNIEAMIRVVDEYENIDLNISMLSDRFMLLGGKDAPKNPRTIHNWLYQINLAIRLALIQKYKNSDNIEQLIYDAMYENKKRSFITHAPNKKYSLKPLRYAPGNIIKNWIKQEVNQVETWNTGSTFGAKPSVAEWEEYGLRGQNKDYNTEVRDQINKIIAIAENCDSAGEHFLADDLDWHILKISNGLKFFGRL